MTRGQVARAAPVGLESAQGHVGVKPLDRAGIAGLAAAADDGFLDVQREAPGSVRRARPRRLSADRGREKLPGPRAAARTARNDAIARGDELVQALQVAITDVAQKCERHVEGHRRSPAASRKLRSEVRLQPDEVSSERLRDLDRKECPRGLAHGCERARCFPSLPRRCFTREARP